MSAELIAKPPTSIEQRHALTQRLLALEKRIKELPQLIIKITHYFSRGVYAREMVVPKGTLLVGKIHKFENLNIISQGDVSVVSIDGKVRIKAPHTYVGSPGAKRAMYVHEDLVWTVILRTDETDLDKIEEQFIVKDFSEAEVLSDLNIKTVEDCVCHS